MERSNAMTTFTRTVMAAGALALGTSGLMADSRINDLFTVKYGRNTPMEEVRLKAERASTAYRGEPSVSVPLNWTEQYFKAKFGRIAPMEEARLRTERESSAYREEPAELPSTQSWLDLWHRTKYGRSRR
jgi:hypothetical protein